jgi:hypothetical protein
MLHVARCMMNDSDACCTLHAAHCTLHAACCMVCVACCTLHNSCCLVHVACCMLLWCALRPLLQASSVGLARRRFRPRSPDQTVRPSAVKHTSMQHATNSMHQATCNTHTPDGIHMHVGRCMLHAGCCVLHVVCCMLRVAQEVPRARIAVGLGDSTGGLYNLEWINNEYVPPASMRRLFYVASELIVRRAKPRFAELRVHISCLQHCNVAWRYTGYRRCLRAPGSSCLRCAAVRPRCGCSHSQSIRRSLGAVRKHCTALRCALHCDARCGAGRISQTLQLL